MSPKENIPIVSDGVIVFILKQCGVDWKVLLLQRNDTLAGAWCQVAGGSEPGEMAVQTALREMKEETSLIPKQLYSTNTCEQFFDYRKNLIYFLPAFVGIVSDDQEVELNEEHRDYQWVSFDEAADIVSFPSQRKMLAFVKQEFIDRQPASCLAIQIEVG